MHEVTVDITGLDEDEVYHYLFSIGVNSITTHHQNPLIQILCKNHQQVIDKYEKHVVRVRSVEESEWKNKWIESFTGFALNDDVYIWPADSYVPEDNSYTYNIRLHIENVFGDGHHPTTCMCGRFLYNCLDNMPLAKKKKIKYFDAGTGTGILPIIAYLRGVRHIELCDIEQDAVLNAEKNLMINDIKNVSPFRTDIYAYSFIDTYDIISANLLSGIILGNIEKFYNALRKKGILIISGISDMWVDDVMDAFADLNLNILDHHTLDEWNAFLLKK